MNYESGIILQFKGILISSFPFKLSSEYTLYVHVIPLAFDGSRVIRDSKKLSEGDRYITDDVSSGGTERVG